VASNCNPVPLIAVPDDALLTTTISTTLSTQPSIKELDCDFERSCSWNNSNSNRFKWTILTAKEAYENYNGPKLDHTLNSSFGSLVAPIYPTFSPFSSTFYTSPLINGTKCIEFWYYAYGEEVSKCFCNFLFLFKIDKIQFTIASPNSNNR
jgi:hypothetical protein